LGLVTILLLLVSNYLCARILGTIVDRLMMTASGLSVLTLSMICAAMLPAMLPLYSHWHPQLPLAINHLRSYSPPAAAAAALTQAGLPSFAGLGIVVCWLIALTAALVTIERWPRKFSTSQSGKIQLDGFLDPLGLLFGPVNGPLLVCWLRIYSRNGRFRACFPVTLVVFLVVAFVHGKKAAFLAWPMAMCAFSLLGFMWTSQFAVNQFGYTEGGFRRLLLLPTEWVAAMRVGSYLFLTLNAAAIPAGAALWRVFSPGLSDSRRMSMLL
jgi:hypothetical protein